MEKTRKKKMKQQEKNRMHSKNNWMIPMDEEKWEKTRKRMNKERESRQKKSDAVTWKRLGRCQEKIGIRMQQKRGKKINEKTDKITDGKGLG